MLYFANKAFIPIFENSIRLNCKLFKRHNQYNFSVCYNLTVNCNFSENYFVSQNAGSTRF